MFKHILSRVKRETKTQEPETKSKPKLIKVKPAKPPAAPTPISTPTPVANIASPTVAPTTEALSTSGKILELDSIIEKQLGVHYTKLSSKPVYEGANGIVYKGTDASRNKVFAIKVVKRPAEQLDEEYRGLVFKEFNNVQRGLGKQVVCMADVIVANELLGVVIEYYPKGDLLDYLCRLRKHKLEASSNVKDSVFKQILKGVSHLHRNGIVHRDLKPENFLLDELGVVKISDFGYSIFLKRLDEEIEWNDILCGTHSFKAPELFQYEKGNLHKLKNPSSLLALDYWSVGVVYFHIYLMQVPWPDANMNDPENKSYTAYAKHYPTSEKILTGLINNLDDKHFLTSHNPALAVFRKLHHESRSHVFGLLNPSPDRRTSIDDVLLSNWMGQVYANPKEFIELGEKMPKA